MNDWARLNGRTVDDVARLTVAPLQTSRTAAFFASGLALRKMAPATEDRPRLVDVLVLRAEDLPTLCAELRAVFGELPR